VVGGVRESTDSRQSTVDSRQLEGRGRRSVVSRQSTVVSWKAGAGCSRFVKRRCLLRCAGRRAIHRVTGRPRRSNCALDGSRGHDSRTRGTSRGVRHWERRRQQAAECTASPNVPLRGPSEGAFAFSPGACAFACCARCAIHRVACGATRSEWALLGTWVFTPEARPKGGTFASRRAPLLAAARGPGARLIV
jgi:hypothetical protein